jgi:hypothetical protein
MDVSLCIREKPRGHDRGQQDGGRPEREGGGHGLCSDLCSYPVRTSPAPPSTAAPSAGAARPDLLICGTTSAEPSSSGTRSRPGTSAAPSYLRHPLLPHRIHEDMRRYVRRAGENTRPSGGGLRTAFDFDRMWRWAASSSRGSGSGRSPRHGHKRPAPQRLRRLLSPGPVVTLRGRRIA